MTDRPQDAELRARFTLQRVADLVDLGLVVLQDLRRVARDDIITPRDLHAVDGQVDAFENLVLDVIAPEILDPARCMKREKEEESEKRGAANPEDSKNDGARAAHGVRATRKPM